MGVFLNYLVLLYDMDRKIDSLEVKRLIKLYYLGQLTDSSQEVLYSAIKSDEKWLELFNNYGDTFYNRDIDTLTERNWARFKEERSAKRSKRNIGRYISAVGRYAAVAVVTLLLYLIVDYSFIRSSTSDQLALTETIVPKGAKSELILPDGTHVWVNSDTHISYYSDFNQTERRVKLSGEAYFTVAKDQTKPFIVETKSYNTRVLGTSFNVMAYDQLNRTETTLVEGAVVIECLRDGEVWHVADLEPGQKIIFDESSSKFKIKSANADIDQAWRENRFIFSDITFEELAIRLGQWYDVEVIIEDDSLKSMKYGGSFKNKETIWQVMDIIKLTTEIDYKLKDRVLKINKRE